MSENIDQLATALAKAQGEMSVAGKNQKNPFFKSSYADFEAIINASRPALSKYGLSVIQSIMSDDAGNSSLITMLMHSSGQWIQSVAKHNPQKTDVQSLSSYNTYLKRMCYTSLIGVATGDDDDGEAAVSYTRTNNYTPTNSSYNKQDSQPLQHVELITNDQLEQLEESLMGHPDICKTVLSALDIDTLSQMPKIKFLGAIKRINEIIAAKK